MAFSSIQQRGQIRLNLRSFYHRNSRFRFVSKGKSDVAGVRDVRTGKQDWGPSEARRRRRRHLLTNYHHI